MHPIAHFRVLITLVDIGEQCLDLGHRRVEIGPQRGSHGSRVCIGRRSRPLEAAAAATRTARSSFMLLLFMEDQRRTVTTGDHQPAGRGGRPTLGARLPCCAPHSCESKTRTRRRYGL